MGDMMKYTLRFLALLSVINALLIFIRPGDRAIKLLIWFPKMIAAALSPLLVVTGLLSALLGITKKDRILAWMGFLGAGLAARYMAEIPDGRPQFASQFDPEKMAPLPGQMDGMVDFQPDLVIAQKPNTAKPLLADLWQPSPGSWRSGLGIIYSHGSGWRVGDKDMLTRPFFRHLVEQGHTVLDIAYSLYPEADLATMVSEVNQAILWMKKNSHALQVNPERVVLVGGSAGAHLSLLAAYAPQQPEFQPPGESGDTTVRGVVAFYPVTDMQNSFAQTQDQGSQGSRLIDNLADALFNRIFNLHPAPNVTQGQQGSEYENYLVNLLGGSLEEIPEIYKMLSPITHVSKNCPPTLILQGSDDVFELAPTTRHLHRALLEAGVPAILVEYPHTEHGFDLILPQISPVAQAATREVDRFLAQMA